MRVFLAAPLFNDAEQKFNSKIAKRLRREGHTVWLAQENTFSREAAHEDKKKIYETSIAALADSNAVVAVLDGLTVDSGVAYELGYAKALKKPLIGLKTDWRVFSETYEVNLMIDTSLIKICRSTDEVARTLTKIIQKIHHTQ